VGDSVGSGRTLMDVIDTSTIEVSARVSEQDRANVSAGLPIELGWIGNELAPDRIVPIGGVDQPTQVGRQRNCVARCDPLELHERLWRRQSRRHKVSRATMRRCPWHA